MATEVDAILVRIEADMADFRRDMKKLEDTTKKSTDRLSKMGTVLKGLFAGVALTGIVNTVRQFEDLQATLKAVTGSADLAKSSFDLITKFTATTTFQLEEVTGAFITLQNAGIAPTSDVLKDVGNLAAAYGKDIRDVAQAVTNATVGEMEMLKQLGIIARVDGDKLNVTYKGVSETIDKSADSIVGYIRNLSQANFPNAIEERSNTLSGAISNLQDNFSLFIMTIGDSGFKQSMTDLVKGLIDLLSKMKPLAVLIGKTLAVAFGALGATIEFVVEHMRTLLIASGAFISIQLAGAAISAAKGFSAMAKATKAAAAGMALMNKLSKTNVIGLALAGSLAVASEMGLLDEVMDKISGTMGEFFGTTEETADSLADLDAEIAKLGVTTSGVDISGYTKQMNKIEEATKAAKLQLLGYTAEAAKVGAQDPNLSAEGPNAPSGTTLESANAFLALNIAQKKLAQGQEEVAKLDAAYSLLTTKDAVTQLEEKIVSAENAMQVFNLTTDATAQENLANLRGELKMMDPAYAGLVNAVTAAGDSIADAFTDMLMNGGDLVDGMKNIARDLIATIIKMQMKLAIINPLMNNLFGLTGDNALPTGGLGSAGGGQMHPSMPRIVGERGPELFIPNSAGTLMNNMNTKNALGGGTTNVTNNVNVTTGVQNTVRAEIMNLLPLISSAVQSDIANSSFRGA